MKNTRILYTFIGVLALLGIYGCEEDSIEQAPLVSFQKTDHKIDVEAGGTATKDILVYTNNKTNSDRIFNIEVNPDNTTADASYYNVASTVTVPANSNVGTFTVETSAENIDKTIALRFINDLTTYTGAGIVLTVNEVCLQNPVTLSLSFDGYPEETYWELYDVADTNSPLYSVVEGTYSGMTDVTEQFCLPDGDYYFVIFDSYGDGMTDGSNTGGYNLTLSDGSNTVLASGEGSFGPYPTYYIVHEFSL